MPNHAILLIHCPDQPGLVARVTEFVHSNHGNILALDQYVDRAAEVFFMRIAWDLTGFLIPRDKIDDYFSTLIGGVYHMQWQLHFTERQPRVALLVSKASHCLYDLLQRHGTGELACAIPLIASNHPSLGEIAGRFGIPFHHLPVSENKAEQEQRLNSLLRDNEIDLVVLARYMQILSDDFCAAWPYRIINIHHSFLPAFKGARPYQHAHERGVKLIGATSHYVTADLDEGPIIAQSVAPVSHHHAVKDLKRIGKDVEKRVLAEAVYLHLQHRILPFGNRTIIFH